MTAKPGSEELLALAEALGRVVPEHSVDRKVLLEAERALRLAAKPDEDGMWKVLNKLINAASAVHSGGTADLDNHTAARTARHDGEIK